MSKEKAIRPPAPELPTTVDQWVRKTKAKRTLNDLVEDVHLMLARKPGL